MSYHPSFRPAPLFQPRQVYGVGSVFDQVPAAASGAANQYEQAYASQVKQTLQQTASTALDQSKQQAIAFAQQQLSQYPTAYEVAQQMQAYAQYFQGLDISKIKDPAQAVGLVKDALVAYAKANGYPTTTKEAETQLAEYAASIAASQFGIDLPDHWPSNMGDLKSVAVDLAVTAIAMETGIDPSIITVTADALADGKLSETECEAIGHVAGAIAGAVIGQACGIPAPIGAFLGGIAGGDIGGTIGQIFGAVNHPTIDELRAQRRAMLATVRNKMDAACSKARSAYWDLFDQYILAMEAQWELAETQIGWKFGLRWFGQEKGNQLGMPFSLSWDPTTGAFTGAPTTANRATLIRSTPIAVATNTYDSYGRQIVSHTYEDTYGCTFDYGCPYPSPAGLTLPAGFERDVLAYLARGAHWIPPAQRVVQCSYPVAAEDQLFDPDQWIAALQADLDQEILAVQSLRTISVAVIGDLVKTTAAVKAEKAIHDMLTAPQATLTKNALARGQALADAKQTGQNLSDLLNCGMLALGVGLVAKAFWRRAP